MLVAKITSLIPTMGNTKTVEDWSKYVGLKPHNIGVVARMFKNNTLNFITDGLRNVYLKDLKPNKFELSTSMMFEWQVETNQIEKIEFADVPSEFGENGTEITMAFKRKYYQMYDIFRIDKTRQQCQVMSNPIRRNDNYWEVQVVLIDNNYDTLLDTSGCQIGDTTTFQSAAVPELHDQGYCKFQSNAEKHRNFMTTFRADTSYSSLYALQEKVFLEICNSKKETQVFSMVKKEKELLDTFMYILNTGLLLNKTNIDVNGKPRHSDPNGRPIYIGEGFIPQIEAAANKYNYVNRPTLWLFQQIMADMSEKSEEDTGNTYMFFVNRKFWNDINIVLADFLADHLTDGAYMYSKSANGGRGGYFKVGATFNAYEFAGNTVIFAPDRALTREYPDKGFGVCIDLTEDKATGKPAVAKYSITGQEFITNYLTGVGGRDGKSSGEVASNVAGSQIIMHGYAGVAVYTPWRSVIVREA